MFSGDVSIPAEIHIRNKKGLLTTWNAAGPLRLLTFDNHDHVTNSLDANGVTITNTYDALGRLRTRGYPDTGVEHFGYSSRGLIAYTNVVVAGGILVLSGGTAAPVLIGGGNYWRRHSCGRERRRWRMSPSGCPRTGFV